MNISFPFDDFWPVAVVERAPKEWPRGPSIHQMILTRSGMIFHNTPDKGEHLTTLDDALAGLPGKRFDIKPEYQEAAYIRLIESIKNPQAYDAILNNCQHTVNRILTGVAESPTLKIVGIITVTVGVTVLISGMNRRG